jgi:hypothetical protein
VDHEELSIRVSNYHGISLCMVRNLGYLHVSWFLGVALLPVSLLFRAYIEVNQILGELLYTVIVSGLLDLGRALVLPAMVLERGPNFASAFDACCFPVAFME